MDDENKMSIPLLFRCPISLDLFTDPVTLSTGQTYDRPSIEKWLAGGNSTCPVTMQRLPDFSVVPNHTLRQYIDRWLLRGVADHRNSQQGSGIPISLTILKTGLLSSETPLAAKLEALRKVRVLSTESDVGKSFLIQLDFFPVLVHLVFQCPLEKANLELVELALDCILRLSPSNNLNYLNVLKQDAAFSSLVVLLEQGSSKMKTFLCILIEAISTSTTTKELCSLLGQSQPVLQVLVSLLLQSKTNEQASDAAAAAMAGICTSVESSRADAIKEGAVEGLAEYLSTGVRRNASSALAAMEVLMGEENGRKAGVHVGAVRVMVKWVFRVSSKEEGSERAVGALMAMCRASSRARKEALAAGAVTQLLLLLQSQCGGTTKARARALLKLLRSSWEEDNETRS
ncbi:hypothetical protein M5K25_012842 [Dendrobium thyrsiflorum]|uniref:U-box domain-containing protein n=1 Tax=Dendrobium thyrsiflorum TaxID=117978 RepID=A0ABD0V5C7_DENTH